MPSTNLAIAMNEIGRLPLSLKVKRARAALKAVAVQVVQERVNPAVSFSTNSNRSTAPREGRSQQPAPSCNQGDGPYLQGGPRGNRMVTPARRPSNLLVIYANTSTNATTFTTTSSAVRIRTMCKSLSAASCTISNSEIQMWPSNRSRSPTPPTMHSPELLLNQSPLSRPP